MNYTELQKANDLLNEIKKINNFLATVKGYSSNIRVSTHYRLAYMDFDEIVYFSDKHKEQIIEVIKEIKDEMIKELNELGVTEEVKSNE